jgi:hypothetical protein
MGTRPELIRLRQKTKEVPARIMVVSKLVDHVALSRSLRSSNPDSIARQNFPSINCANCSLIVERNFKSV